MPTARELQQLGFSSTFVSCYDAYSVGGAEAEFEVSPVLEITSNESLSTFESHVVSKKDVLTWDSLKSFAECHALGLHRVLRLVSPNEHSLLKNDGPLYFVSHKWHNGVPDESGRLLQAMKDVRDPDAWFWVDYSCLDLTRLRLPAVVSRSIRFAFWPAGESLTTLPRFSACVWP